MTRENRDIVRLHHVVCIWMIIKILQMELMEIRDLHFIWTGGAVKNEEKAVEIPAYFEFTGETLDSIASAQISEY